MPRLCSLTSAFLAAVLLLASASSASSNESSISMPAVKTLVDAIYSRGRREIMTADISHTCRQTALTALAEAAAADSEMKCSTTSEKVEDIAEIFAVVWVSIGDLMDDVNTMVNGIPLCMGQYQIWNIPGKLSCIFTRFWPIWNAAKHFWNYQDFWMKPYGVIKDFAACVKKSHSVSTSNVKMILNNAKYCN